jgi:hypothetical protein
VREQEPALKDEAGRDLIRAIFGKDAIAAIRQGMEEFERCKGVVLEAAERKLRRKHGFSR